MKKATPALLLAGLAVAACLQAQAAEPQATQQPQATADTADTANAVMVGIDARTGKLRPLTAGEARALAAKAATMPKPASRRKSCASAATSGFWPSASRIVPENQNTG